MGFALQALFSIGRVRNGYDANISHPTDSVLSGRVLAVQQLTCGRTLLRGLLQGASSWWVSAELVIGQLATVRLRVIAAWCVCGVKATALPVVDPLRSRYDVSCEKLIMSG